MGEGFGSLAVGGHPGRGFDGCWGRADHPRMMRTAEWLVAMLSSIPPRLTGKNPRRYRFIREGGSAGRCRLRRSPDGRSTWPVMLRFFAVVADLAQTAVR